MMMKINAQATELTETILTILEVKADEEQFRQVRRLIEHSLVERVRETEDRHSKAAYKCCPADEDLAHKIQRAIRKSNTALIANLESLR